MNNFYSLIYLISEIKSSLIPFIFKQSLSPHKNVWEAEIAVKDKKKRLVFSSHSMNTALFPDHFRPLKKNNTVSFFESVEEHTVTDVQLADNDRVVSFVFTRQMRLVFRLFGNHPNIFLVENGTVTDAFKSPSEHIGKELFQHRQTPATAKPLNAGMSARQAILGADVAFPRHLIDPVIQHYRLGEKSPEECRQITLKLTQAMLQTPEFRILENGNICLIPGHLLPVPNAKIFDTISEAIRFAYYKTSGQRRLSAKKNRIQPALERFRKKLERTIQQLTQADKGLERAETYEQFGHILMAHAHENTDFGAQKITLPNFYDGGNPVSIPLQPNKSLAENAQNYYKKSSDAIRNVEESERRLTDAETTLQTVRGIEQSFHGISRVYDFDDWMKEHEESLKKLGILSSGNTQTTLPFRKADIDGYEIWIGKNAKSNDKLTTMAHKEDIWLHARGVSGSHVVIRMNNQKEMPPKSVILKAAAVAAWNSKARGSALVPVLITKRKYVVKPKGALAGTVRVQKETVEMIKPQPYKKNI